MKAEAQIRAHALLALQAQDREEVRLIRSSMGKLTILLTTASFGLSAFLIQHRLQAAAQRLVLLADLVLVIFIWVTFLQLYLNLRLTRKSLIARERLLNGFDATGAAETDLFPDLKHVRLDIADGELFWLPCLGTAAVAIKVLILSSL